MRIFATPALALFILATSATVRASSSVTVFLGGAPGYFSGTNARVDATAIVGSEAEYGITEVRLYMNGQLVRTVTCPPGEPFLQHKDIGLMFDSTHFETSYPGFNTVAVRAEADIGGQTIYSGTVNVPVKNVYHVFGRYDLEEDQLTYIPGSPDPDTGHYQSGDYRWAGTGISSVFLELMGHAQGELNTSLGWPASTYISTLSGKNVCYVNSHGGLIGAYSYFSSDTNDNHITYPYRAPDNYPGYLEEYITGFQSNSTSHFYGILAQRQADNGTGLPPFNTTGHPPVNFAWVDGCSAGRNDDFSTGYLYPYGNYYAGTGPYPENQAFASYLVDVYIVSTSDVGTVMWEALRDGYTVHEARDFAWIAYEPYTHSGSRGEPTSAEQWMVVLGDFYTRLHGVYSGTDTDSPQTGWLR